MGSIAKKLKKAGVSKKIVKALKKEFGENLHEELQKNGFQFAVEKAGINPKKIPNLDISDVLKAKTHTEENEVTQENSLIKKSMQFIDKSKIILEKNTDIVLGKVSESGEKTGLSEVMGSLGNFAEKVGFDTAVDNVKNMMEDAKSGITSRIKKGMK